MKDGGSGGACGEASVELVASGLNGSDLLKNKGCLAGSAGLGCSCGIRSVMTGSVCSREARLEKGDKCSRGILSMKGSGFTGSKKGAGLGCSGIFCSSFCTAGLCQNFGAGVSGFSGASR